jgi:hypothetical protein
MTLQVSYTFTDARGTDAPDIAKVNQALGVVVTGGGAGTLPPPPGVPQPILTMPPNVAPMATVDLGAGPDTISLLLANLATDRNVVAVAIDGTIIAGPLTVSADNIGQAGGQLFNIHGNWGPGPHKITVIPQPAGSRNVWINAVTYDLQTYVHNGPSINTNNTGSMDVNVAGTWDLLNLPADWTPPVAVAPPAAPPPGAVTTITATVDGASKTDTLVNLLKGATKTVVLPAGLFQGTGQIPAGVTVSGAGMGKTLLDGTSLTPAEQKACLVPQGPGCVVQDMTIQNYTIPASSGANAAAVRDDAGGCAMLRVEVTKCQDGIKPETGVWSLDSCNIHGNGAGAAGGGNTHEVYADPGVDQFNSTNSDFTCGSTSTHAVKSRAKSTSVKVGTLIANAQDPSATYAGSVVDIPNGGAVDITAMLVLPANAGNRLFFGYGADDLSNGSPTVKLNGSIFVDNTGKGGIIAAQKPGCAVDVTGCTYVGPVAPTLTGWATVIGTITPAAGQTPPPVVVPPPTPSAGLFFNGATGAVGPYLSGPASAAPLAIGVSVNYAQLSFGTSVAYGGGGVEFVVNADPNTHKIYGFLYNPAAPGGWEAFEQLDTQIVPGQFHRILLSIVSASERHLFIDGVEAPAIFWESSGIVPPPPSMPLPTGQTSVMFGGLGTAEHNLNGYLANAIVVAGAPTAAQIQADATGADPIVNFGTALWLWAKLNTAPDVGGMLPDSSGQGHNLTAHAGADGSLPKVV